MLAEVETLLIIQDRDQKIRDIEKDLKVNMPNLIAKANARLDGDLAAVAKTKEENQANEIAMKSLELEIDTRKDSILKLKHQQFETKKNEEFQSLGQRIEEYGKEIEGLEDQELELMEVGENLSKRLADEEKALARTQELVDDELAQLKEREKNELERLAEFKGERDQHGSGLDDALLSIYDRIFAKKGDQAVAPLVGQQCKGCHMKVTPSTVQKTKLEKEVTHCENCGRILYMGD